MPNDIQPVAAGAGDSNEDLKSLLYPQGGGTAIATAPADDPDHDPEFDDPKDTPAADPAADPDAEEDPEPEADPVATTEADPETDPETDPAPEAELDDDKALLSKARFTPDQQKVVDKLLGKKTAANRELREKSTQLESRAAVLEQENEQLRQALPAPVASPDNPVADAATEVDLVARERNALTLRNWLVRNRDGGELPDGKGGKTTITPERRDELLAETDELLMVHVPARRHFIQQRRVFDGEARKAFPDLADPKSELSLRVDQALRFYPALQSMPEARLFIADALAHKEARQRGSAAKAAAPGRLQPDGKGTPQSLKAPRTEGAPRVAARVDPSRKRADQAISQLEKTGRDDGNVALAQLITGRGR